MIRRKKPRKVQDHWEGLRAIPGALVPDPVRKRGRKADALPEAFLQGSVNEYLWRANLFQFRLSERVVERAGDWTVAGWPDSPMIAKLPFGVSLLGPMELKKEGEELNAAQAKLAPIIGTQVFDTWPAAERYMVYFQFMVEYIADFLRKNPPPKGMFP